jgi:hypothetical protein
MKFLLLLQLAFYPLSSAANKDTNMRFRYQPAEAEAVSCTHKRIRDLPDWEIRCGEKQFVAHVVIREYQRQEEPRTSVEILYWVTDRNSPQPKFHSGSNWIRLKKASSLDSLQLSQGVENDYASLELDWTPTSAGL